MRNRTMLNKRIKLGFLLVTIVCALVFSSLAFAQATNLIGLSCASEVGAGGDVRLSPSSKLYDAIGQAAIDSSSSASAILRSGYIQSLQPAPSPTPLPTAPPLIGDNLIFLSSVWSYVKSARVC